MVYEKLATKRLVLFKFWNQNLLKHILISLTGGKGKKEMKLLKKFNQNISEGILFTDQYQLVMGQLYFKMGIQDKVVQFDHFFRNYPDTMAHIKRVIA